MVQPKTIAIPSSGHRHHRSGGARSRLTWMVIALAVMVHPLMAAGDREPAEVARQIYQATGVRGGLVVHLGCGDGTLTAALKMGDGFRVHGLDRDPDAVDRARHYVQSIGTYGPVAIDLLRGNQLPYADNLVNLMVAEDTRGISETELMRVLAPGGVAYTRRQQQWIKKVKPVPRALDQWTHYLHDASNNAVSHDTVVGPPNHLQWVGGPRYSRHHDRMSSISAVVSAGGRVFSIIDLATRVSILTPPKWTLIARDAYNGTILWTRAMGPWYPHLWPLKSGPAQLPRRLVAVGDRVYVTLSLTGPITALDAASGKTVRTYDATRGAEELIVSDGMLLALVNEHPEEPDAYLKKIRRGYKVKFWDEKPRKIVALRAADAAHLWTIRAAVLPTTLAANRRGVFFHDGQSIVCVDRDSGKRRWRSEPVARAEVIRAFYAPTLVLYDDVVLFSGGETAGLQTGTWYRSGKDTMTALSADHGKILWSAYHPPSGYRSPEDLLVAGGLVWTGETTSGRAEGLFTGRDPRTGKVESEFTPDVKTYWFHHRCYRGKATDRYLLMARAGTEFVDIRQKKWNLNDWFRGSCMYGVMPANGLIYAPPNPCACFMEAKLSGFNALGTTPPRAATPTASPRLIKGPAYAATTATQSAPEDWPTYRHDAARSGQATTAVPGTLETSWRTQLSGHLSSPVIAVGKVFVAEVDRHTVRALDAQSGRPLWTFTAGGRVDSPPTYYDGRVLFGSRDGWVYALRATDGVLAWQFRAAPIDRRIMAFDQLESSWPVSGSLLVENGELYCVAGRSMFLDGGLRLCRLNPRSGQLLTETVLGRRDASGKDLQSYVSWLNLPTALPDILSSDGRLVYMRSQPFQLDGTRLPLKPYPRAADADRGAPDPVQNAGHAHLFCPSGFLDASWWHRSYWMWGSMYVSGWSGYYRSGKVAPAGRILVFDAAKVYGFGRKPRYYRWSVPIEYELFAADKKLPLTEGSRAERRRGKGKTKAKAIAKGNRATEYLVKRFWHEDLPILARAMVLSGDRLLVAGPPDRISEPETFRHIEDPKLQPQLAEQAASIRGERGARLLVLSAVDGQQIAAYDLDRLPVFDGLAAARHRLFLTTIDGAVLCFSAAGN